MYDATVLSMKASISGTMDRNDMEKPLPPNPSSTLFPDGRPNTSDPHNPSLRQQPNKPSPTKPLTSASATVPRSSRVAPARDLHVPDLSRTGWTAWLSGFRAWYQWPRTATTESKIAIVSPRQPAIQPPPLSRSSSRRSSADSNSSGHPGDTELASRSTRPRRQYVPRRPKMFAKLRKTLAVTSLVVVGTLIGMFLVFAATTLFATTFVGCAVMLFLESTILVIPAIIFLIFFVFVLIILGLSWLGLFGLRFGLDSWSLVVNRSLSAAHWMLDSAMSVVTPSSHGQSQAKIVEEVVPLDFAAGNPTVAPSA